MKAWKWIAMSFAGAALISASACGGDDPVETDETNTTTTSTTTVTTSTTTTSTTTTTMPTGGICDSGLFIQGETGPLFDGCLSASCCDTFNPCVGDNDCAACLQDPMGAGCSANATFQAYVTCSDTNCPGSICGTTLGYGSPQLNRCLNSAVCAEFNACEGLPECNACLLDPMGSGCDVQVEFQTYQDARAVECPSAIGLDADGHTSGIRYVLTYESNMEQDTAYDTNKCANDLCSGSGNPINYYATGSIHACADPSGELNNLPDYEEDPANDTESADCLLCLQMASGCPSAIQPKATEFQACMTNMCN